MLVVSINVGVGIHRLFTYVSMKAIYWVYFYYVYWEQPRYEVTPLIG